MDKNEFNQLKECILEALKEFDKMKLEKEKAEYRAKTHITHYETK